jgi:hypothetical protein
MMEMFPRLHHTNIYIKYEKDILILYNKKEKKEEKRKEQNKLNVCSFNYNFILICWHFQGDLHIVPQPVQELKETLNY